MNGGAPAVTASLLAAGCGGSSTSPGSIRALDAVLETPSVDLVIDGAFAVGGIGPRGSSGYVARPAGSHEVRPVVAGTAQTGAYFLEVPAGRHAIELRDGATGLVIATFPTPPLAAGSSTTALVSDAAPGSVAPLTLGLFADLP